MLQFPQLMNIYTNQTTNMCFNPSRVISTYKQPFPHIAAGDVHLDMQSPLHCNTHTNYLDCLDISLDAVFVFTCLVVHNFSRIRTLKACFQFYGKIMIHPVITSDGWAFYLQLNASVRILAWKVNRNCLRGGNPHFILSWNWFQANALMLLDVNRMQRVKLFIRCVVYYFLRE